SLAARGCAGAAGGGGGGGGVGSRAVEAAKGGVGAGAGIRLFGGSLEGGEGIGALVDDGHHAALAVAVDDAVDEDGLGVVDVDGPYGLSFPAGQNHSPSRPVKYNYCYYCCCCCRLGPTDSPYLSKCLRRSRRSTLAGTAWRNRRRRRCAGRKCG